MGLDMGIYKSARRREEILKELDSLEQEQEELVEHHILLNRENLNKDIAGFMSKHIELLDETRSLKDIRNKLLNVVKNTILHYRAKTSVAILYIDTKASLFDSYPIFVCGLNYPIYEDILEDFISIFVRYCTLSNKLEILRISELSDELSNAKKEVACWEDKQGLNDFILHNLVSLKEALKLTKSDVERIDEFLESKDTQITDILKDWDDEAIYTYYTRGVR